MLLFQFVFIEGAEVPAGRRPYKLKEALHLQNKSPTSTSGMRLSELCTYAFVFKGNSLELLTSECITPHYNHMYNRVFIM